MPQGIVIFDEELQDALLLLRLQLVFGEVGLAQFLSSVLNHGLDRIFESLHQHLSLLLLGHQMLLILNALLSSFILLNLGLKSFSSLLKDNLSPLIVFLEHTLDLLRDQLRFILLVRMLFQHLEELGCQLLVVDESLFDIGRHTRGVTSFNPIREHRLIHEGTGGGSGKLHLSVPAHKGSILVLNCRLLR